MPNFQFGFLDRIYRIDMITRLRVSHKDQEIQGCLLLSLLFLLYFVAVHTSSLLTDQFTVLSVQSRVV